jgi:5-methylcytosine-specific restriction protein A
MRVRTVTSVALSDITREAVLASIAEYDELGRDTFLERYGFDPARACFLVYEGQTYDSKAIVGVAHGHATGETWKAADFSGGEQTVARLLRRRGFHVRSQANPDWAFEELILACELVMDAGWQGLRAIDPRVGELSTLLQQLPIHDLADRGPTFRNRNSVARKSYDISTAHPEYAGKPTRGGRLDKDVLDAFLERPADMKQLAHRIREGAAAGTFDDLVTVDENELAEIEAPEGKLLVRQHLTRERSRKLRQKKIAQVRAAGGQLECAVCGFDFEQTYGPHGEGYIECHHVVPLHASGETKTRLDDLALICANCHRMIHRRAPWLTPAELERIIKDPQQRDGRADGQPGNS